MKLTFEKFTQLFLESILDEDKSRLIDRLVLPDIDDEEEKQKAREEMKAFFKKYNTWENKLDWNKLKTITYADFEKIKAQAEETKGAQKREIASDIKSIFKSIGNRKFEVVGENDNWLFVAPLNYEAAVYCDSAENQGAGAKWCIGSEGSPLYWDDYTNKGSLFILAFNKNYRTLNKRFLKTRLKFMLQREKKGNLNVWKQSDVYTEFEDGQFDISKSELNSMFDKVQSLFNVALKQDVEKKIKNLKNISVLEEYYFGRNERQFITTIDIPDNVTKIERSALAYCNNLKSITLPDSITDIESIAFAGTKISNIVIPNGIPKISSNILSGCKKLKSVTLPDSITSIGRYAFNDCISLSSITLPDNVESIDEGAFSDCTGLTDVTIGKNIKFINEYAFSRCSNLKNLTFKGKTLDQIKAMENYPWYIDNPDEVIKAKP